jgi:hypothetical protein
MDGGVLIAGFTKPAEFGRDRPALGWRIQLTDGQGPASRGMPAD